MLKYIFINYKNKNQKIMFSENDIRMNMNRIISIFSLVFCSIGIISNLISIFICLRRELRQVPTFVFFAFLSFINILKLISIGVFTILLEFIVNKVEELDERILTVGLFALLCEYQCTAYFKVIH